MREAVVVGGGVIGLAVVFELAHRGRQVTLIDRDEPGGGATATAGGMLAPVSEAEFEEGDLIRFGLESLRRYPEFVARVEAVAAGPTCGYRDDGTLWVALGRDDLEELHHLADRVRARGLSVEEVSADAIWECEPRLSGRVQGGMCVHGDHQVDPRRLAHVLTVALRRLGAEVVSGVPVERVAPDAAGGWQVHGRAAGEASRIWRAEQVVLAAGAWQDRDIESPGGPVGLRPVKGQLIRLAGEPLLRHVVRSPDVYLIPRQDGELLVGATMEEMGFDSTPTAGATMDLLRRAWELLPGVYELEVRELCTGLRSAVEDHRPVIGPDGEQGLYLAAGHYRNGVLLAPATATLLVDAMLEGRVPEALAPFAVERVAGRAGRAVGLERS